MESENILPAAANAQLHSSAERDGESYPASM